MTTNASRTRRRGTRPMAAVLAVALVLALGVASYVVRSMRPPSTFDAASAPEPVALSEAPPSVTIDRTIATGLTSPWGLAFLPDGDALVGERDTGRILRVPADGGEPAEVGTVDGVLAVGEGGLLGLAVPAGPEPDVVLAYVTTATDNRVVRLAWDDERLGEQVPILTGIPANTFHNGGRLLALDDGSVLVSTGDAGLPSTAQDPASLAGKILRITADGTPGVYSLGHRNVQGLALDSEGRLWASEFGAADADELNQIRPGANYGWPVHEGGARDDRYVDPAAQWSPTSTASPSGIAIVDDVAYVASLRGEVLWQVPLAGERAAAPIAIDLGDLGRLRTVAAAPDGSLWLITSNTDGRGEPGPEDDRILRLTLD